MSTTNDVATQALEREMMITRRFNAPRALVFDAWTRPEQIGHWWGPRGFTTTTHEIDLRVGGVWRFTMHGPDGVDYPNRIVYDEIVKPERIAYTHGSDDNGETAEFKATITFEEEDGGTRVTLRLFFNTAEEYEEQRKFGAIEGGNQTLDRLGEYVAERQAERGGLEVSFPSDCEIAMKRVFDAPRSLVFEAWTRPEHVARWWGPRGSTITVCEIDLRVGGAWRFVLVTSEGVECAFRGIYREIASPERLVNTEIFEPYPDNPSLVTTTFEEHEGQTTMTSVARYDSPETREMVLQSGMEGGAAESYNRLAELVAMLA